MFRSAQARAAIRLIRRPDAALSTIDNAGLHRAMVVAIGMAALMVLTVAVGLWHQRQDALTAQSRTMATLSSAAADELQRGLGGLQVAMQSTRDDVQSGRLQPAAPDASLELQRRVALLWLVRKLWLVGPDGGLLVASAGARIPRLPSFGPTDTSLASTAFVDALALSEPFVDVDTGSPSVALALPFMKPQRGGGLPDDDPGQELGGWVMAEVSASSLLGAFPMARPAPDARMVVRRADGAVLAGTLALSAPPAAPQPVALTRQQTNVNSTAEVAPVLVPFSDGSLRLLQARQIEPLGLTLVMTRDTASILEHWRELRDLAVFGTLVMLVVLTLLLRHLLKADDARLQTQRALQTERDRATLAFAAAREGNWDWDPVQGLFYLSPRMRELLGMPPQDAPTGHSPAALRRQVHPDDIEHLRQAVTDQIGPEQPRFDLVMRVKHEDDQWHAIRLRGTAAFDGEGQIQRLAGVGFDVSEELAKAEHTRRLEAHVVRKQRLESLGTLAGGVAHDFNNILAAVQGYSEMARQVAEGGSDQARHLDQVLQAAQRGKAVIERILSFSRGGVRPHSVFAVEPVLEQVLGLLAPSMGSGIRVERDLPEECVWLRGDATAFFEAVMNLCTNALQAMPGDGLLRVSVSSDACEHERWFSHGQLAPGQYLRVAVSDSGVGIDPRHMDRLFEPFFTTRGPTGTGLGLAVVHAVAQDFGGAVDVLSSPGQGSTFSLWLPRVAAPALSKEQVTEPATSMPSLTSAAGKPTGQGQTILIVDDDPALVNLTEEALAALGYEPVGLCDPRQALALLAADPQRFDLLVTDEVMPGLHGCELATRARQLRADLPVLLLSGYGGPGLARRAQDAGVCRLLSKPVRGEVLAEVLAELLAGSAQAAPVKKA